MKKLWLIVFVALLLISCTLDFSHQKEQKKDESVQSASGKSEYEYNKNGHPVSYTEYYITFPNLKRITVFYDGTSSKRETRKEYYNGSGKAIQWYEYEYNESGFLTKETRFFYGSMVSEITYDGTSAKKYVGNKTYSDGKVTSIGEYEYNSLGNLVKFISHDTEGRKKNELIYEGTPDNRPLVEYFYDQSGAETSRIEREYNSSGILIKTTQINGGRKYVTTYDETGKIKEHVGFDETGAVTSRSMYNADSILSSSISYFPGTEIVGAEAIYSGTSGGENLETTYYDQSGKVSSSIKRDYNSDSLLVKETSYNASGAKTYERIYDGTRQNRELIQINYDENGIVTESTEYSYNTDGYLSIITAYFGSGSKRYVVNFDGTYEQRELNQTVYDESGNVSSRNEHIYNSDGNLLKYKSYYGSGGVEVEIDYDGSSRYSIIVSRAEYYESGVMRKLSEYNSDGYAKRSVEYYSSGMKKQELFYDGLRKSNLIVLRKIKYNDSGIPETEFEYNSEGYTVKITYYYASGAKKQVTTYDGTSNNKETGTIRYDESGNVI